MANPKFLSVDGTYRDSWAFTTTIQEKFFSGSLPENTLDVEISIDGSSFEVDPDYIYFENNTFIFPNPEVFPEGYILPQGLSTIKVRSIFTDSSKSIPAVLNVSFVTEADVDFSLAPPSGILVERTNAAVRIKFPEIADDKILGYNLYASRFSGGGVSGYAKINTTPIRPSIGEVVLTDLNSFVIVNDIPTNVDGTPLYDPTILNLKGNLLDPSDPSEVVEILFNEALELPESTKKISTTLTVQALNTVNYVVYQHNRQGNLSSEYPTIPNGEFAATLFDDPLYYIVTAVYLDSSLNVELESSPSIEVAGKPLALTPNVGTLPQVSQQQIIRSLVKNIIRTQPNIRVDPGSVLDDVFIRPAASEFERITFMLEFVHRCQSFATLMEIDDPTGSGVSIAVSNSAYKQALLAAFFLSNDSDVQALIDQSFDRLALRFGEVRQTGTRAIGVVVFSTARKPIRTIQIPIGTLLSGGSAQFRTVEYAEIPFENSSSFFNAGSGRYEVYVNIAADEEGPGGSAIAGQIRQVLSGPTNLQVNNPARTVGGLSAETNSQLAARVISKISSLDVGTAQGYRRVIAEVPGVIQAKIIDAGDPLMHRDYDATLDKHLGGKVDIYIQGNLASTVTDTFTLQYTIANEAQFVSLGDPALFVFQCLDPRLTIDNPIYEMLENESLGLGLVNRSTLDRFDLTNVSVLNFNTIKLDSTLAQPSFSFTDLILGDFKFTTTNLYELQKQPVEDILKVSNVSIGDLNSSSYALIREDSPYLNGRSVRAKDKLSVTTGTPLTPILIQNESHVLIGEEIEYLDNLGVNPISVVVFSPNGAVIYNGPYSSSNNPDYALIPGTATSALGIKRTSSSGITNGSTVSVRYTHDPSFTVLYSTNLIVSLAQDAINNNKHLGADVLVKEVIETPIDISATIILDRGQPSATVDRNLRTDLSSLFNSFRIGDALYPSDIVRVMENTQGVNHVLLNTLQLYRGAGSLIVNEQIAPNQVSDIVSVSLWSTPNATTWLLTQELSSATSQGGGDDTAFRSVLFNNSRSELILTSPNILGELPNRSFIIGDSGASIPGYSDDATLTAQGYMTNNDREVRRRTITKNRIIVSLPPGSNPDQVVFLVTYKTSEDSGAKEIATNNTEVLVVGNFSFTYDEVRR